MNINCKKCGALIVGTITVVDVKQTLQCPKCQRLYKIKGVILTK